MPRTSPAVPGTVAKDDFNRVKKTSRKKKITPKGLSPRVERVTTAGSLSEVCERVRRAGRFAFDTEFIKEDRYEPIVCLLQLAVDDAVFLIDPLVEGLDVISVWELLADPEIEVVVHAGAEDLSLCQRQLGKPPAAVFDVQVAAGLIGYDYPLSLLRLVRATLGARLHKSQTLTDWRRRPLSETQERYAADDVAYLPAIYDLFAKRLDRMGRRAWAAEEFARLEEAATRASAEVPTLRRIKGTGSLDARALAIVQSLSAERDVLAERLNRPVRGVLRDHLLVEIARRGWTDPKQIRSLRGLSLNEKSLRQLAAAVKRGQAVPEEECPQPPVAIEDTAEEAVVMALVMAVIRSMCLEKQLAYALVTSKEDIRWTVLARVRGLTPPVTPSLLRGWRHEVFGPAIDRLLAGEASVYLSEDDGRPRLRIQGREAGGGGD